MNILDSFNKSVIIGFLLKLKIYADNSLLFSMNIRKEKKSYSKEYRSWIESSLIYRLLSYLDRVLMSLEKFVFQSINKSVILSHFNKIINREKDDNGNINEVLKHSSIYKFLSHYTYTDLLIFIPTAYVVVDYIVRRLSFLGAISSLWDELMLIFSFGVIVLARIFSGGRKKYNFTPMDLPIIIYIILGICHVLIKSPDLSIAIEGFRAVFQHIFWYFVATQLINSVKDSEKVMGLMTAIGLFLGLHSIYQYIAKVPMPGNWVDVGESITTRAFSIIGSPNILGVIFVLFIPIAFSMGITRKENKLKLFYLGSALFMVAGLLLTMSRGAWLAFAFGVFIFILAFVPKLIIPFAGIVAAFILFGGTLSERLLYMLSPVYLMKSAAGGRLYRWEIGLDLWRKNKLFGLGLGRYGGAVAMNNNLTPFYLDNYYLKTLTEMGIFGIVGLGFVIICFVLFGLNIIRRQKDLNMRILTIGLFSGCLGVLAQNFVENIFEVPAMIVYFWIAVALINTFAPKANTN